MYTVARPYAAPMHLHHYNLDTHLQSLHVLARSHVASHDERIRGLRPQSQSGTRGAVECAGVEANAGDIK